tara:strand:- start:83 stop:844 length:762 start_codon:yes stop_codon:yes gene_type:complete
MSQFKFSIITVVKNDQENILKTLKSVLKQKKLVNLEYIVIDGNSSDKTLKIINQYQNEIDKIISENDNGIYYAMNKGIKLATGNIIAFCNSGDELKDKGLHYIQKVFSRDNCDFVFGTIIRNYIGDKIIKHGYNEKRIYFNFDFATSHSCGFYVKKNIINEIGNYNVKYKCSSDYDFYYRLISTKNFKGGFTKKNEIVGEVASGGFSSKLSFFEHLIEETKIRIDNNQNKIMIIIIFINALLKRFLKRLNIKS